MLRALSAILLTSFSAMADEPVSFSAQQVAFYEKDVQPLLKENCLRCHGGKKSIKGGLNLMSRAALLEGGDTGPAVDLKNPEKSLLLRALHYEDGYEMPPSGKLKDDEIAVITTWVKAGLPWTEGHGADNIVKEEERGVDLNYWAYQSVQRPSVPTVKNPSWVRSPIDAFVLAKLEEKGLQPVATADKATLIRRVYYDLTGLPPTPRQIDDFVNDASPNAYERLVDQLLTSPHYGEKWGRHWLDLVRFAETNGYERDGPKPFAWRYRDYVIRSFNEDKPYDQFIREQIAGDELPSDKADPKIATAFYRLGLWDDEPADPKQALFDGYDDYVTVVGQTFLAMTLNCARCHDHKGDFFPQADYYKMVAFFRGVRPFSDNRDVVSKNNQIDISAEVKRAAYEEELRKQETLISSLKSKMLPLEKHAIKKMDPKDQLAFEDGKIDRVLRKVPQYLDGDDKTQYLELRRQLQELVKQPSPNREMTLGVNNCIVNPEVTNVMIRGNPHAPAQEVQPGFPTVFQLPTPTIPQAKPGAKTSGRRTVLANWLASKENPLTARVMMNRVWQYHFGQGIVPTPNDFGKLGQLPSNQPLLDWLANEFMDKGWTLKQMHKQIMLSNTYRLASSASEANLSVDPANQLHWRFPMRRLSAEEVRDTILNASGDLKLDMFGPSVFPKIPAEVLAGQSRPGEGWHFDPNNPGAGDRRSVYVFVKRSLHVPILVTHDQADSESPCPVRYTTTVPTQALGMLNGEFMQEQADKFAERLRKESPNDLQGQVKRAIRITTGRTPSNAEVQADVTFINEMRTKFKLDDKRALQRYALMILNTNEFIYLD